MYRRHLVDVSLDPMNRGSKFEVKIYHLFIPLLLLALGWMLILVSQNRFEVFPQYIGRLVSVVLFILSVLSIGGAFLRKSELKNSSVAEKTLFSFTTGLIVYFHLTFFLGILHLYEPAILILLFYLPSVIFLPQLNGSNLRNLWSWRIHLGKTELGLLLLASIFFFYSFIISLNPIIHYDALVNHLNIPAEYLIRHGIEKIPYNIHSNLPPASHMINLLLLAGAGDGAVQIFSFILVLFIALAFSLLTRSEEHRYAWLYGILIFVLIPQVSLLFSLTNIDFLTSLFTITSLLLLLRMLKSEKIIYPLPLSLHLAFLINLKYQTIVFVFIAILFLIRTLKTRQSFRNYLLLVFLVVIFSSPSLVKNYFFTKNPIFPFAAQTFHIHPAELEDVQGFIAENNGGSVSKNPLNYVKIVGLLFTKQPEIGLLPLLMLLSYFRLKRIRYDHRGFLLFFIFSPMLMMILFSSNVTNLLRWNQYSLALISLLVGMCLENWVNQKRTILLIFLLYVGCSFYLSFIFNIKLTNSFLVGTGKISEEQYRKIYIPSFELREKLAKLEGTVLFIGESRGFYNVENSVIPSAHNLSYIRAYFDHLDNVEQLRSNFLKHGVRYLFINVSEIRKNHDLGKSFGRNERNLQLLEELSIKSDVIARDRRCIILKLG